jgi:XRE family aerobic/anaerobic benzoate catabolism transcriptional regulator
LKAHDRAVIAVGGGVVSEEDSFQLLLAQCHTIWLKATPEEHMERVIAQGDLRPMAGNNRAMEELKRILRTREPLYRKAHAIVDTSGSTIEESLLALQQSLAISTQSKGGQTWNPQSRR